MSSTGVRKLRTSDDRIIGVIREDEQQYIQRLKVTNVEFGALGAVALGEATGSGASRPVGNFLERGGDVMDGPIAFTPREVQIKDDTDPALENSIQIGFETEGYSTYVKVLANPTPDEIVTIYGAQFDGQLLYLQGQEGAVIKLETATDGASGGNGGNVITGGEDLIITGAQIITLIFDSEASVPTTGVNGAWRVISGGVSSGKQGLIASISTDQLANFAIGQHIEYDTLSFARNGLTVSTGVGQANGIVSGFLAGKSYSIRVGGAFRFGANTGSVTFQLKIETGGGFLISTEANGISVQATGQQESFLPTIEGFFEPTADTDTISVQFTSSTSVAAVISGLTVGDPTTYLIIEDISSGGGGGGSGGGGDGHIIQDEGNSQVQRANLNFTGAGVTVTDDSGGNATIVDIPEGAEFFGPWTALHDAGGFSLEKLGFLVSNAADPAETGFIRMGNAQTIVWEANPAGTDVTLQVNANNNFVFSGHLTPSGARSIGLSGDRWATGFFNALDVDGSSLLAGDVFLGTTLTDTIFPNGTMGTDIKMGSFDINTLDRLLFDPGGDNLNAGDIGIASNVSNDMIFNVATSGDYRFKVALGSDLFTINATENTSQTLVPQGSHSLGSLGDRWASIFSNTLDVDGDVLLTGDTIILGNVPTDEIFINSTLGADLKMGTFDITGLDRLLFDAGGDNLLATDIGIASNVSNDMLFNVATSGDYRFKVALGTDLFTINATENTSQTLVPQGTHALGALGNRWATGYFSALDVDGPVFMTGDTIIGNAPTDDISLNGTFVARIEMGQNYIGFDGFNTEGTPPAGERRLFADSDNSDHLSIRTPSGTIDLEASGSQTPWLTDIDADGNDLNDFGRLQFRSGSAITSTTIDYIVKTGSNLQSNVGDINDGHLWTILNAQKFGIGNSIINAFENLSMNNNKITSLATPTASTDAATKGYVDSAGGGGLDGVQDAKQSIDQEGTQFDAEIYMSNSKQGDLNFSDTVQNYTVPAPETIYYMPIYIGERYRVERVGVDVSLVGANDWSSAIYDSYPGINYPRTRITNSTNTFLTGSGIQTILFNEDVEPGLYFIAIWFDAGGSQNFIRYWPATSANSVGFHPVNGDNGVMFPILGWLESGHTSNSLPATADNDMSSLYFHKVPAVFAKLVFNPN